MAANKDNDKQKTLLLAAGLAVLLSGMLFRRRQARQGDTFHIRGGQAHGRALITGASSGIGESFARQLALRGYDLTLVARREERLSALAEELTAQYGGDVRVVRADLADEADLTRVEALVSQQEPLALLINNAGFGTEGKFAFIPLDSQLDMLSVHLHATVRLTRAALPGMLAQGRGGIINVSSIASVLPLPGSVMYSATKSFLNIFSETLQIELDQQGIFVQALCPGYTHTGFHNDLDNRNSPRRFFPEFMWSQADEVVATSLKELGSGRVLVIPGLHNQAIVFFAQSRLFRPIVRQVIRWLFLRKRVSSGPLARSS